MEEAMWHKTHDAVRWADEAPEVRVVVISGAWQHFTSGLGLRLSQRLAHAIFFRNPLKSPLKLP